MDRHPSPQRPSGRSGAPSSVPRTGPPSGSDVIPDGPRHRSAGGDASASQQLRLWAGLKQARQLLARFSRRDLTILLDRDLNPAPKPARTLAALSRDYGMTRQPVRQIGRSGVAKVRGNICSAGPARRPTRRRPS